MKHSLMAGITALLAAAVLASVSAYAGSDLTDAAVQSYEDQLSYYRQKKAEALGEIESIRVSSSNTLDEIRSYDEVIRYNTELKKLEMAQLDTIEKQIADAKANISEAEDKLESQQKAFENRMVAGYDVPQLA